MDGGKEFGMSVGLLNIWVSEETATIRRRAVVLSDFLLPLLIGSGEDDPNRVAFCNVIRVFSKDYPLLLGSLAKVIGSALEQSVYPDYEDTMRIWSRIGKDSTPPNDRFGRALVLVDGLRRVYATGRSDMLLPFFTRWYPAITLADMDLLLTSLFRVFYIQYTFTI